MEERHYSEPDTFGVTRNRMGDTVFGDVVHGRDRRGRGLRMEARAVLGSLLRGRGGLALTGDRGRPDALVLRGPADRPMTFPSAWAE